MIGNQAALIKREFWEHRSIWVTPAAISVVTVLMAATGLAFGGGFQHAMDVAIVGASNIGEAERRALLIAALGTAAIPFAIAMWVLTIFYCLDTLYAERKDKSILFWRSLPITDTETILSKVIVAVGAIPLATLAGVILTQLANLLIMSIWVNARGGSPGHLLWDVGAMADIWGATLIFLFAVPIWLSPFIGWFLFVSAFTKRSPLLVAFLPLAVLPLLEYITFRSTLLKEAIFIRSVALLDPRGENNPLLAYGDFSDFLREDGLSIAAENFSVLSIMDLGKYLSTPSLWLGLVACGMFLAAAVYVRRYRDES